MIFWLLITLPLALSAPSADPSLSLIPDLGECGLSCASAISAGSLNTCLVQALGPKKLIYPGDASYSLASTMFYGRKGYPEVIVTPESTDDVSAAVKCAFNYGFPVSAAGRRHSYYGLSILSGYVVIDFTHLCPPIEFDGATMTAKVGPGCSNANVLGGLAKAKIPGLLAAIGNCPSVGVVGYTLGGGQSDYSPYFGLGCDQLVELEMVLYNGTVITVNNSTNEDLFWASCGGGPGMAIITGMKIKAHISPNPDAFTSFKLIYQAEKGPEAIFRLQSFLVNKTNTNNRLYGGMATVNPDITVFDFFYLGSWKDGLKGLADVGIADPLLLHPVPFTAKSNFTSVNDSSIPQGVIISEYDSFTDMVGSYYCEWYVVYQLPTISAENCTSREFIQNSILQKEAVDVESFLSWGGVLRQILTYNATFLQPAGLMASELPLEAWQEIQQYVTTSNASFPYCDMKMKLNHFTHGAVQDVPEDATAYPWRNEVYDITYGEFPYWKLLLVYNMSEDFIYNATIECKKQVNGLTNILLKYLGPWSQQKGYLNYLTSPITNWQSMLFGKSYPRLQEIKTKYDPLNVFGKPYSVEGLNVGITSGNNAAASGGGGNVPSSPSGNTSSSARVHSLISAIVVTAVAILMYTIYVLKRHQIEDFNNVKYILM